MASSRILISSQTLGSSAASVTFSSIPNTYQDLCLVFSCRSNYAAVVDDLVLTVNNTSSSYSETYLRGTGTSAVSGRDSYGGGAIYPGAINAATSTTSTFTNQSIYIPSYTVTQNRPMGIFSVQEQNSSTNNNIYNVAGLYSNTAVITSIKLYPNTGSFVSGSTFYLYGINK